MEANVNTWTRLRAIRRTGRLRKCSELEVKVLSVLLEHADSRTGRVRLSAERIALGELEFPGSGVCTNVGRVRAALTALETLGVIKTIEEGGGRDRVAVRELLLPDDSMPLFDPQPASLRQTGTAGVPELLPVNRDGPRPNTGTLGVPERVRNRDGPRPQTGTLGGPLVSTSPKISSSPPGKLRKGHTYRHAGGRQEEEDVLKYLDGKLWPGTREFVARLMGLKEVTDTWKAIVSDATVVIKTRNGAYFKRLKSFIVAQGRAAAGDFP